MGKYKTTDIIRHLDLKLQLWRASCCLSTPGGPECDLQRQDYGACCQMGYNPSGGKRGEGNQLGTQEGSSKGQKSAAPIQGLPEKGCLGPQTRGMQVLGADSHRLHSPCETALPGQALHKGRTQVLQSREFWPGVTHGFPWLEVSSLGICSGKGVPLNVQTKLSF